MTKDDFNIAGLTIDPTDTTLVPARAPGRRSDHKARRYFVKVPWAWVQKLEGASGQACLLALRILVWHFRERGASIELSNKRAEMPSSSKRDALRDLERRGLVAVQWRGKRAPVIKPLMAG
jgi:hypothetical protein